MPYLHLGSLRDENSRLSLVEGEAIDLFIQGLSVLEHLHSRGVAYRDLKSDNILAESRSSLRVQFTDFGLANDRPDLRTFCGTEQYAAPEIFTGGSYTTAVDIWSLGVIVLEYVYGLPTQRSHALMGGEAAMKERGLVWCRRLIEYANEWDSDRLDLFVTAMLRMQPQGRLSASACLRKGYELGIFNESFTRSRHATPTQTKPPAGVVRHEEETPTVIVDALWDAGRVLGNYNYHDGDNDRARRFTPDRHFTRKTLTSRQLDILESQNDGIVPQPRKGTPEVIFGPQSDHVRLSKESASPPEIRSMSLGSQTTSIAGREFAQQSVGREPGQTSTARISPSQGRHLRCVRGAFGT